MVSALIALATDAPEGRAIPSRRKRLRVPFDARGLRYHPRGTTRAGHLPQDIWWGGRVLRELRNRGMAAPEVAVGDGALGFWPGYGRWAHHPRAALLGAKVANVLSVLPKRARAEVTPRARGNLPSRD